MNQTAAREAARRLYKRVSYSDGPLGNYELSSMMSQTYEFLKIPFKPAQNDIKWYEQILDADRDGKVTLKDLETRAIEYLVNNSVVSTLSGGSKSQSFQSSFKSSEFQVGSKGYGAQQTSNYSAYSQSSYAQSSSVTQPKYNQFSQNDYLNKYDLPASSLKNRQLAKIGEQKSHGVSEVGEYSYNYKPSFPSNVDKIEINQTSLLSSNFGGDTLYSYDKNESSGRSYNLPSIDQGSERSSQYNKYGGTQYGISNEYSSSANQYKASSANEYKASSANEYKASAVNEYKPSTTSDYTSSLQNEYKPSVGNKYASSASDYTSSLSNEYKSSGANDYTSPNYVNQSVQQRHPRDEQDHQQYGDYEQYQQYQQYDNGGGDAAAYNTIEYQQRPYSETVRQYLGVVGQVFMKLADPEAYTVTEEDVPELLRDTYAVLGRDGYEPSQQDVKTWMKLCDVNQDGKVQYQEYQYFVVKSLERSGLNLYD